MTKNDISSDDPGTSVTKKPYEKPAFRYEQIFVTTALTCGKVSPSTQGQCGPNPSAS